MGFSYHRSGKFCSQALKTALKSWESGTTWKISPLSAFDTQTNTPTYRRIEMTFNVDSLVELSKMILLLNKKMWKSRTFLRIVVTKRLLSS